MESGFREAFDRLFNPVDAQGEKTLESIYATRDQTSNRSLSPVRRMYNQIELRPPRLFVPRGDQRLSYLSKG